jgi:hypothetical protein
MRASAIARETLASAFIDRLLERGRSFAASLAATAVFVA